MKKVTTLIGSALFISSMSAQALEIKAGDPAEGGISYEFEVHMNQNETANIVGAVGAKSSYEPEFEAPNIGWTHTSNWTALMIHQPSLLTITVKSQAGVVRTSANNEGVVTSSMTGDMLYPGISVYSGWDDTSETEKGSFNSIGNFWSTIQHIGSAGDLDGNHTETYNVIVGPGQYSLNFGGVNALHCAPEDMCFNGLHGYSATISTSPVPHSYGMDGMSGEHNHTGN